MSYFVPEDMEDFFEEVSTFDQKVYELKESLRASVKEDFIKKIKSLEEENAKLRVIRDNWDCLESELKEKCDLYEKEAKEAVQNAKEMRFNDLVASVSPVAYKVACKTYRKPKCDKCDGFRQRQYITPLGRKASEECICNEPIYEYYVEPIPLVEFQFTYWNGEISNKYYLFNDSPEASQYTAFEDGFSDNKDFSDIYKHRAMFRSEDKAKQYAEWLQEKERKSEVSP